LLDEANNNYTKNKNTQEECCRKMKKFFKLMLVAFVAVALGGCATVDNHDQDIAKNARKELALKGVSFDARTFIKEASDGNLDMVKLFVDAGMDVNVRSNDTALIAAAYYNRLDVVKYLIENGANVSYGTYYIDPIVAAVRGGSVDIVKFLIASGSDVNDIGYDKATPLYVAAEMGRTEIAKLLIKNGAKVDYMQPWTGLTPLAMCAKSPYGNKGTIEALVNAGANVNYKTPTGLSVLDWALMRQKFDCLEFLLAKGADANNGYPSDYASRTILSALAYNQPDAVKILVKHGISVNAKAFGKIPLAIWCSKNFMESMAILLVDMGADTSVTYQGESLLGYAIDNREEGLVKKLDPNFDVSRFEKRIVDPNIQSRETQIKSIMGGEYYKAQHTKAVDSAVSSAVQTNEEVGSFSRDQLQDNTQDVIQSKEQKNTIRDQAVSDVLQEKAAEAKHEKGDYNYPVDQEKLEREIDAEIKKIESKYSHEETSPEVDKLYEESQTYQPVITPVPKNEQDVYSGKGNVPIQDATPTYVDKKYESESEVDSAPMNRNLDILPEAAEVLNQLDGSMK
jgi:ankyrin repeat protein